MKGRLMKKKKKKKRTRERKHDIIRIYLIGTPDKTLLILMAFL